MRQTFTQLWVDIFLVVGRVRKSFCAVTPAKELSARSLTAQLGSAASSSRAATTTVGYGLLVDSEGVSLHLSIINGGFLLVRWLTTMKHNDWLD